MPDPATSTSRAKWIRFSVVFLALALLAVDIASAQTTADGPRPPARPFPQSGNMPGKGLLPSGRSRKETDAAVADYYRYWKRRYVVPSSTVPGGYKIDYDGKGSTVSEAIGYGMMISAYMAGEDADAKPLFDGLNAFRKRFPSKIRQAFMCWKIPPGESGRRDDSATDGDLDIAFALLLAHAQWGEDSYLQEARALIGEIGRSLVREDHSLRLGDWNEEPGQTRPSDIMPTHFRAFRKATGDELWEKVEAKGLSILSGLQSRHAPRTGLIPDFALLGDAGWRPADPKFLESAHDGEFHYNACRVPWRIGWAAERLDDAASQAVLKPFMEWVVTYHPSPASFVDGFRLDGSEIRGAEPGEACFSSPTGVAAMVTGHQAWLDDAFAFAASRKAVYYQDSVNLLCLLVMSGNAWMP